ncbi:MarR-like DNA-binding transcriptional regulator SgrR of sgrS sRNA [Brevibacillus aydinogluensis]|uniref:SgrR family transcriptional regulator n=1 Tax=Brevibacillus aydinogluensis TaxID=927786 RepID=UPI000E386B30|nr:SgrR family transcriptional regulator [Brevibacillus aydinogluensis]MDT3416732.1 MarR-like DNA-binding transcriptional regulator SgrR of sgrS sRNA [Brevibacillus aydinogluensis]REK61688.1 MAG: ABC transporter substrate-binding protein [Brevibacillus sp.]
MILFEHYHRLFAGCPQAAIDKPITLSLACAASILCCTPRNAAATVKKLAQRGWIVWQPGKGRGHQSVLTFRIHPADAALSVARELVRQGEIRGARVFVARYREELGELEESFQRWMSSQFGLHVSRSPGSRQDVLRLSQGRPLPMLDPSRVLLRSEAHLTKHVFDTLVHFDPQQGRFEPRLALYWEANPQGTEWTFILRKGVWFHHGRMLEAEDVRYALLRLRDKSPLHQWLVRSIRAVDVVDAYTLRIRLHHPDSLLLHALSKEFASIVPFDYTEQMGEQFGCMPSGTGPFRVVRNDDSMLVLEAFEPYFGGRPFTDRIEIWCVPDMTGETEAGWPEIVFANVPGREKQDDSRSTWTEVSRSERCFQYLGCNMIKPGPVTSAAFRSILDRILDRRLLLEELGGLREPAVIWGEQERRKVRSFPQTSDAEILRRLQASGYREEPLRLVSYPDQDHVEDAEWIRMRCARYGIDVRIVYVEPEEMARPETFRHADLVLDSANIDEREELSLLEFLHDQAFSPCHHLPPEAVREVTARSAELARTFDEKKRRRQMQAIVSWLLRQRVFLPLYRNRIELLAHPRWSGLSLNAHGWPDFSRMFVRA